MSTGYFELIIAPKQNTLENHTDTDNCSEVLLYYKPATVLHDVWRRAKTISQSEKFDGAMPEPSPSVKNILPWSIWSREQIDDFVRKLGFLETQKIDEPVKKFQQLNQVCNILIL